MKRVLFLLSLFFITIVVSAQSNDLSVNELLKPTSRHQSSCYSSTETVKVQLINTGNTSIDFSVDTLVLKVNVWGAVSFNFSKTISDNSLINGLPLQVNDTFTVIVDTIDMTLSGNYFFRTISTLNNDTFPSNDTLTSFFNNTLRTGYISSNLDTVCGTEELFLEVRGTTRGALSWQRLENGAFIPDTGKYNNAQGRYHWTTIDSTTSFRVASCGTVYSDTITIVSNLLPPKPLTFNDTTFGTCAGNEPALLTATSFSSTSILGWYRDSVDTSYIAIGDTFKLYGINYNPSLPYVDSLYVSAKDTITGCESGKEQVVGQINMKFNPDDTLYYLTENFNQGIPYDWNNKGWEIGSINNNNFDGTPMAYYLDDFSNMSTHNRVVLTTPILNPIPGSELILEFDYNRDYSSFDSYFVVQVYDTSWNTVSTPHGCANWTSCKLPHRKVDISEYINSSLKIRFLFDDGKTTYFDPFVAVDNIKIYNPPNNLGSDTAVCDDVGFILETSKGFNSYLWSTGDTNFYVEPISGISKYSVNVINSFGCSSTDTVNINVNKCNDYTYFFEDFNSGIPSTWTNTSVNGNFDWMHGLMYDMAENTIVSIDSTPMVYFNDDSLGNSYTNNTVELISPIVSPIPNVPLLFEFDYNYRGIKGISDTFKVEVYDGNNWIEVFYRIRNDCGGWGGRCNEKLPRAQIDITGYINDSLQVKFTYNDGNDWAYWAAFDNVHISNPDAYHPVSILNTVDSAGVADSLYVRAWTSGTVAGIDLDSNDGCSFTIIDQSTGSPEGISVKSSVDIDNYVVNEGDSLMILGVVGQQNGLQQFFPDSIVLLDSNKGLPTHRVVNVLNEATESQLIKVRNITVVSIDSINGFVGVSNRTDTFQVKIEGATDISFNDFYQGKVLCSIKGIGGQTDVNNPFLSDYYITPMRTSDIVFSPQIDLGHDTLVCTAANYSIDAGAGFASYTWNTGDTTQSIQVSQNDSLYIVTAVDANGCTASDSVIVNVDICSGLPEVGENSVLNIYPNPSKGIFYIEGKNLKSSVEIELIDYNGKLVYSIVWNGTENFKKEMDLSMLAKGIYFVKFRTKDLFEVKKIVLQ